MYFGEEWLHFYDSLLFFYFLNCKLYTSALWFASDLGIFSLCAPQKDAHLLPPTLSEKQLYLFVPFFGVILVAKSALKCCGVIVFKTVISLH